MEMIAENVRKIIEQMDHHLRTELLEEGRIWVGQLWEHTYIRHQIEKRNNNGVFSLEDHIRAMVYAMLSATIPWDRVEKNVDLQTGRIICMDEIFCNYEAEQLLKCAPDELGSAIQKRGCAGLSTWKQMEALITVNIPKLAAMEKEYGSIDAYYQKYIEMDGTLKTLITAFSASGGKDKMVQLDVPLVCEYLRNVGYDLPKPDTHICRILGKDYLAFSSGQPVPQFEALDLVVKMAKLTGKANAEVDCILWLYCAAGGGNICIANQPKCSICEVNNLCGSDYNRKAHSAE